MNHSTEQELWNILKNNSAWLANEQIRKELYRNKIDPKIIPNRYQLASWLQKQFKQGKVIKTQKLRTTPPSDYLDDIKAIKAQINIRKRVVYKISPTYQEFLKNSS